ncbi:MAG: hypothetical protein DCF30_10490, partial [Hyphomicrobiales bacterium]
MSEAGQDWARRGAAAAQDANLASFAADGALLLWDDQAQRPGFANAAGHALLGGNAQAAALPAPTRQRFSVLAGGLASRDGVRLERLRLTSGFSATIVTCGCQLLTKDNGEPVLAIAVQAAELRRLGIVVPRPAPVPEMPVAPAAESALEPEEPSAAPAGSTRAIRFLWQSDVDGRLTNLSTNMAELIGKEAAASLPERLWAELIGSVVIDRSGGLAARLAGTSTWSGHEVLWRTTPGEGARVELSGVPVLDAARQVTGFRGFGVVRPGAREPFVLPIETPEQVTEAADTHGAEASPILAAIEPEAHAVQRENLADIDTPSGHPEEPQSNDSTDAADEPEVAASLVRDAIPDEMPSRNEDPAIAALNDESAAPAEDAAVAPVSDADMVEALDAAVVAPAQEASEAECATKTETELASSPIEAEIADEAARDASEPDAAEAELAAVEEHADPEQAQPEPAVQEPVAQESAAHEPAPQEPVAPAANIVPLRNGNLASVRPVLEPSKPNLSSAERNAFREIAKALGARIAGDDEA